MSSVPFVILCPRLSIVGEAGAVVKRELSKSVDSFSWDVQPGVAFVADAAAAGGVCLQLFGGVASDVARAGHAGFGLLHFEVGGFQVARAGYAVLGMVAGAAQYEVARPGYRSFDGAAYQVAQREVT